MIGIALSLLLVPGPQALELELASHRAWESVKTLRVVTEASGTGHANELSEIRSEIRISAEGSLIFDFAHGNEHTYVHDPDRASLFLHEDVVHEEIPYRRVVVEYPAEQMRRLEALERSPLWALLGWWPAEFPLACPEVHGESIRLPSSDAGTQTGVDLQEDGDLLVLRTRNQELGLSRAHGLAIRYRRWRAPDSGSLLTSMHVNEFFEPAPGIWFPRSFDVQRHNPEQAAELRTVRYRVIEASVNDLEPEDFLYRAPPGTYRVDADGNGGGRQLVAGGFDLMQSFVRVVRSGFVPSERPLVPAGLGVLAGLATFLIGACFFLRRRA